MNPEEIKSVTVAALDRLASHYRPASDPDAAVIALESWWIDSYVQGPKILELGCGDGTSTRMLLKHANVLHVVEGAADYCKMLRTAMPDPQIVVNHCFYEDYQPDEKFDDIVFVRSLDDVVDPIGLLNRIRTWLRPAGRLHIVVQNAESLHRRLGVALRLLSTAQQLSEHSISVAHRRVYTKALLQSHLTDAGFRIDIFEGYFLKPFDYATLGRTDYDFSTQLVPALFEVGKQSPTEFCCLFYVLCHAENA